MVVVVVVVVVAAAAAVVVVVVVVAGKSVVAVSRFGGPTGVGGGSATSLLELERRARESASNAITVSGPQL